MGEPPLPSAVFLFHIDKKPIPKDRPENDDFFPSFASGGPWLQAELVATPIVTQPTGKSNENFCAGRRSHAQHKPAGFFNIDIRPEIF
jgi:hypothetical protein